MRYNLAQAELRLKLVILAYQALDKALFGVQVPDLADEYEVL